MFEHLKIEERRFQILNEDDAVEIFRRIENMKLSQESWCWAKF
jgi:hypothetical protein